MKFTEEKLEQAFIELIQMHGFEYVPGGHIQRSPDEVIIEADFRNFLLSKYEDEKLTNQEVTRIIQQLKIYAASDLYESNKAIMKLVSEGFILKREDRSQKDLYVQLIDYHGLTALRDPKAESLPQISEATPDPYSDENIYKFVNQFEIIGFEKRIPDGILYINGLPLVVFEFKTAIREETTIHNAFEQLTVRYRRDIPELFKYNAFCVISDGVNVKFHKVVYDNLFDYYISKLTQ
jgi:type I restriction enzyme R subunit